MWETSAFPNRKYLGRQLSYLDEIRLADRLLPTSNQPPCHRHIHGLQQGVWHTATLHPNGEVSPASPSRLRLQLAGSFLHRASALYCLPWSSVNAEVHHCQHYPGLRYRTGDIKLCGQREWSEGGDSRAPVWEISEFLQMPRSVLSHMARQPYLCDCILGMEMGGKRSYFSGINGNWNIVKHFPKGREWQWSHGNGYTKIIPASLLFIENHITNRTPYVRFRPCLTKRFRLVSWKLVAKWRMSRVT